MNVNESILIPLLSLQTSKYNQLSTSNNNPRFYLTADGYDIHNNTIFYICEIGIFYSEDDVIAKRVKLRYSNLYELYQYLLKTYGKTHKFKYFPPKKILYNGTKKCAEERLPILNMFLSDLTNIRNLIQDYTFRDFMTINEK